MNKWIALAVASFTLASTGQAADSAKDPPLFPAEFVIGRAPPGSGMDFAPPAPVPVAKEKPSAVNGLLFTAITPIFTGQNSNFSYIRLPNGDSVNQSTLIGIIGATTGTVYGQVTYTVPPGASPQYGIGDIELAAGITGTINEPISLYVENPNPLAAFQHVIFNSSSLFFENASVCTWLNGHNYHYLNQGVTNVHTTAIPGYPSLVTLHNLLNSSVGMALDVYLASSGRHLGRYSGTATANTTYAIPMATIQTAIGWIPGATDYHVNIVVTATTTGTQFYAVAGQQIYNSVLQTYINMSEICPINQ